MLPLARMAQPVTQNDFEIQTRIKTELENQKWAPVALVEVMVTQGIVDFWGTILDERDRKALKVLAENVPGVKAVNDHTVWVEPTSGFVFEAPEAKQVPAAEKIVA